MIKKKKGPVGVADVDAEDIPADRDEDVEGGDRNEVLDEWAAAFFSLAEADGAYLIFFSSRRRHTRSLRDWSSDVCSSDLPAVVVVAKPAPTAMKAPARTAG